MELSKTICNIPEKYNDKTLMLHRSANVVLPRRIYLSQSEKSAKSQSENRKNDASQTYDSDTIRTLNGIEIFSRCQFHQHFMGVFFEQKYFMQLFSNYSLALLFLAQEYGRKSCS